MSLRRTLAQLFGRGPSAAPAPFMYPVAPSEGHRASAAATPRGPRPGGYYLNADGSGAHNANGEPVPLEPDDEPQALALRTRAALTTVYQAESMSLAVAQEIADDAPPLSMAKAAPTVPPGGSGDPAP